MKIHKADNDYKRYNTPDFSLTIWKKNSYPSRSLLTFLSDTKRFNFTAVYIERKEASYVLKEYRKNVKRNATNLYNL